MSNLLVDANVILDLLTNDPQWAGWSQRTLTQYAATHTLCINPIIYSELSIAFTTIEDCEEALARGGFQWLDIPREALFLAGKVFLQYRRNKGPRHSMLPDFYIGAHAAVQAIGLITRDVARYRTYFPTVPLITPDAQDRSGT